LPYESGGGKKSKPIIPELRRGKGKGRGETPTNLILESSDKLPSTLAGKNLMGTISQKRKKGRGHDGWKWGNCTNSKTKRKRYELKKGGRNWLETSSHYTVK